MLEELRLRGLGVIDEAVLDLGPGFTAITGETGAGKTMILTALGLLLGGRADSALVRSGHELAAVEGRLSVDPAGPVAARAVEAGASLDGDALIIARQISAEGRSRAYLGGRGCPVGVLAELADQLVTVHGQADQRGLLRPSVQRGVLDAFAGAPVATALQRYARLFSELSTVQARLVDLTTRRRERAREADQLRFGLAEVDAAAPVPGEDHTLRVEAARLGHVEELRLAAQQTQALLAGADGDGDGDQTALALLAAARRALEPVRGRDDALDALGTRLAEVAYLLSDVSADLSGYASGLEADPARLEAVHQRLAQLTTLTRKYGADVDAVRAWADAARARLAGLDGDDDRVDALTVEHDRLLAELAATAGQLSAARRSAADRLAAAATAELAELALPHARLLVAVRQRADESGLLVDGLPEGPARVAFGASGIDDVELLLVPHPGAPARPLHRGASGGELSRVMLALEVVLAGTDPVPTFVFDEVDAGVGGRAAVEVGRRLAALARTAQVVVVTHLPQVAAFADHHIVVRKSDDGRVTSTDVRPVSGDDRLEELARMLAGLPDSVSGRDHAEELLATASATKVVS